MSDQEKYILDSTPQDKKSKKFFLQPQTLLLCVAALVLIMQLLVWGNSIVLHVGKFTVFIGNVEALYMVLALLITFWFIYVFTKNILYSEFLSWFHIGATVVVVLFFLLTHSWFLKSHVVLGAQTDILKALLNRQSRHMNVNSYWGILFIVGQLAYVVNSISGYIYKRKNSLRNPVKKILP